MGDDAWRYFKAICGVTVATYFAYLVGRQLLHIRDTDNLAWFVLVVTFVAVATSGIWLKKR